MPRNCAKCGFLLIFLKFWGIENFAEPVKRKGTLDDIARKSGKNLDVVFVAIALTLVSPYLAVAGALLSSLYYSGTQKSNINQHSNSTASFPSLYRAIESHNERIRKKLIEYGIRKKYADRLVRAVVYEGYIDGLVSNIHNKL